MAYEIDTDRVVAVLINARTRRALNPKEVEIILRYVEQREKVYKRHYALAGVLNKHVTALVDELRNQELVTNRELHRLFPAAFNSDEEPYDEWLYTMDLEIDEDEDEDDASERLSLSVARDIAMGEADATHAARIDALLPEITELADIDAWYFYNGYPDDMSHAVHRFLRRRVLELQRKLDELTNAPPVGATPDE